MPYDEQLAVRIREVFRGRRDVSERKMFGGVAFMYRTRMCCGVVGNDLVVRIAADEFAAAMRRKHVRPMDFTGKPMRGFVYVSRAGLRTTAVLRSWVACGERFVQQASAKPRRQNCRSRMKSAGGGQTRV
jgi:hypothetical protein